MPYLDAKVQDDGKHLGSEQLPSLKLTAKGPENGWLGLMKFLLGR